MRRGGSLGSTDTRGDSELRDGREAVLGPRGAGTGILRREGDAIGAGWLTGREGREVMGAGGRCASKVVSQ